jgi:hypothetical protein
MRGAAKTLGAVLAAALLVGILTGFSPSSDESSSSRGVARLAPATIGTSGTFTDAVCVDVTTCSISITPAEWSVMVLTVGVYGNAGTSPSAVAANSAQATTWTDQSNTATTSSPQVRLYTSVWLTSSSKSVTSYVNYSAATYYALTISDFTNIDVTPATLVTATTGGLGNTGSNTTPRCAAIASGVAGAVIIMGATVLSTSTFTAGGAFTKIASGSTTTDVITTASEYLVYSGSGALTPAGTWGTTGSWTAACMALRPATVPSAPTNPYVWGIQTSVLTISYTVVGSQAPYVTFVAVIYAPWNTYTDTCGSYSGVPSDSAWNTTQETIGGLTPGTSYCFEVYVDNTTGSGPVSVPLTDVTTVGNLNPPSNLEGAPTAAAPQTEVTLVWSYPSDSIPVANYSVSWGTTYGTWSTKNRSTASTALNYIVTGLAANTTYFFEVWSWASSAQPSYVASNIAVVHTEAYNPKQTFPPNLDATGTGLTTVSLVWTALQNTTNGATVTDYSVWYCPTYGGTYTEFGTTTNLYDTIMGLALNTTYYTYVDAALSAGLPVQSNIAIAHTEQVPPPIVTAPILSVSGTGLSTIAAAWTPGTNFTAVNYTLEYGTTFGSYPSHVSEGTALEATVSGLTQNATYFLVLVPWTSSTATAPASNVAIAHTLWVMPGTVKPPVLSATSTGLSSVVLTWTAGANFTAVNYTLEYGTTYGSYPTHVSEGVSLHATAAGLAQNTTYFFVVVPWTGATATGPSSNVAPAHTGSSTAPIVTSPILSVSAVSLSSVTVTWTAGTNFTAVNYTLEYGTTYGSYPTHVSEGSSLHAAVTGLALNTTYWFVLAPWTSSTAQGPVSNVAPAHTLATPPPIIFPSILAVAAVGLTSVTLSWTAPQNVTASSYTVKWGTTYGTYTGSTGIGASFEATVAVLAANTTYFFVVAPNVGPTSNIAPVRTLAVPPPIVVDGVLSVVAVGISSVNLTWSPPENVSVSSYTIHWGTVYGVYPGSASVGGATHYQVTGLLPNTTYFFVVDPNAGPGTNIAPAHTESEAPLVYDPPVLSVVAVGMSSVNLTWTPPSNVTVAAYEVVWGTIYGSYPSGESAGTALHDQVTGLSPNTTYYFLVEPNAGRFSNVAPAHTLSSPPPTPAPYAPVITSAAAVNTTEITVTWTAPVGTVTNYSLEYARFYGVPIATLSVGTVNVYNVTGLGFGLTYYFEVRAWNLTVGSPPSNIAPGHTDPLPPTVPPFPWDTITAVTMLSILGSMAVSFAIAGFVSNRRGRRAEGAAAVAVARTAARVPGRAPAVTPRSYSALERRIGRR